MGVNSCSTEHRALQKFFLLCMSYDCSCHKLKEPIHTDQEPIKYIFNKAQFGIEHSDWLKQVT